MLRKVLLSALLVVTPLAQAEWFVSPKISAEYMDYSTDWLEDSFIAPAAGVSIYNTSGWFMDVEVLSGSGDTVDRDETTATIGKSLGAGYSLFAGLKDTTTTGTDVDGDYWDFNATGFFAGLNKSVRLGSGNSLAFSAAVASLSGDVALTLASDNFNSSVQEGDALGLSLGGAWNANIGDAMTSSIGAKYQSYDYDNLDVESIVSVYGKLSYRF